MILSKAKSYPIIDLDIERQTFKNYEVLAQSAKTREKRRKIIFTMKFNTFFFIKFKLSIVLKFSIKPNFLVTLFSK